MQLTKYKIWYKIPSRWHSYFPGPQNRVEIGADRWALRWQDDRAGAVVDLLREFGLESLQGSRNGEHPSFWRGQLQRAVAGSV